MNEKIDYSPEGKNKIEIDKLHVEVAEMRSRFRRWIGSLGGLLGIVTAAVSVLVTSQQWDRASREMALSKTLLATERAKFDGDRAEAKKAEALKILAKAEEDSTKLKSEIAQLSNRLTDMRSEVANQEAQKSAALKTVDDQGKVIEAASKKLPPGPEKTAALKAVEQKKENTARWEAESVKIQLEAGREIIASNGIRRLSEELASAGYNLLPTKPASSMPAGTEVRYYHEEDEALGRKISDILQEKFNIRSARTSRVDNSDEPVHSIQITLARDVFAKAKLPTAPAKKVWAVQIGFWNSYSTTKEELVDERLRRLRSVSAERALPLNKFQDGRDYYLVAGPFADRETATELLNDLRNGDTRLGNAVRGVNWLTGPNLVAPPLRVINVTETFKDRDLSR
jgi:hypothetical protein